MQPITISLGRLLYVLTVAAAIVYGLAYAREVYGIVNHIDQFQVGLNWINLDEESTLPSWFSASLLLLVALLMFWAARGDRAAGRRTGAGWFILALGFIYLSLDEATAVHESFSIVGSAITGWSPLLTNRWLVVAIPAVVIAAILFIPFLLRLPRRTAMRLVLAGIVFLGGAVGIEMINGVVFSEHLGYELWRFLLCLEETLEVVGTLLAIWAVGSHIESELGAPALRLGGT